MRMKLSMYLKRAFVFSLTFLMIGFLGFGVRAFATAAATDFILATIFVVCVVIFVLYLMIHRPTRELTTHSLFREPFSVKRALFPHLYTIGRNLLTLHYPHETPFRANYDEKK